MNLEPPQVPEDSALVREWRLLRDVDPIARAVLDAADPWAAYHAADGVAGLLVDHLTWMPHGGQLYIAWSGLTDLYEEGAVAPSVAHQILREAATRWLARPGTATDDAVTGWLARTLEVIENADTTPD